MAFYRDTGEEAEPVPMHPGLDFEVYYGAASGWEWVAYRGFDRVGSRRCRTRLGLHLSMLAARLRLLRG